MKFSEILLTPFCYIYVLSYRLREKIFGYDIVYNYLPKDIPKSFLIIHMDPAWISRGFLGMNKCLVPHGDPYSDRFDQSSPYFQTWVGTYYINTFKHPKSRHITYLGNAAIEDQNFWLYTYGVPNPNSRIIQDSINKISERKLGKYIQKIYYCEIKSEVDDSKTNKFGIPLVHTLSTLTASIYNKKYINPKLLQKDKSPSEVKQVNLFGYISIIEISKKKFLLTYVCGTKENKEKINDELKKIMNNIDICKLS